VVSIRIVAAMTIVVAAGMVVIYPYVIVNPYVSAVIHIDVDVVVSAPDIGIVTRAFNRSIPAFCFRIGAACS